VTPFGGGRRLDAVRADQPNHHLIPGFNEERNLAAGDIHRFPVQLASGQFFEATIVPQGIDVGTTVVGPDGRTALTVDLSDDGVTQEPVLLIADAAGEYAVAVKAVRRGVPSGRYTIRVDAIRSSTAVDVGRADALRKLEAAVRARGSNDVRTMQQAEAPLQSAIEAFARAGDRVNEGTARLEQVLSATFRGLPNARALASETVALYRELGDKSGIGKALWGLSVALERQGEMTQAMDVLTEALALSKASGNVVLEAHVRNRRGVVHGMTGEPERAVDEFLESLRLTRLTQIERVQGMLLNNLGIATKDLGDQRLSLDYYTQALAAARANGRRSDEATILNNIGNLQRRFGEHEKARQSHMDALVLAREIGNVEHEARALNTLGFTNYRLGNFQQALEYHKEALAIRRRNGDPTGEASALQGIGQAWHRLGNYENAIANLNESLRIRRAIAARLAEPETLLQLAVVERDRGNLNAALEHIETAVEVTDSLRGRVVSPDLRASYVAVEHEQYELHIDVLMQLRQQTGYAGFAARALEASERGRARMLLESLSESSTDVREGIDAQLLESERAARRQVERASTRLSQLLSRNSSASQVAAARNVLETANAGYRQVQVRIRQESPAYAALTQPRSLTTEEIQREVLDPDTVLLEYALGEKRSWLWAVTPTTLESFELPSRTAIDTSARRLYGLLTARQPRADESASARSARIADADRNLRSESAALAKMLLGDAAADLGEAWRGKRLLMVAPEVLQYIPFTALVDPAAAPRLLVDDHEVISLPSASVLSVVRKQTENRPRPPKQLAVLADPVFEADDPRIGAIARKLPGPSAMARKDVEQPDVSPVARAMRSMEGASGTRVPRLSRLPFSREEARAIAGLVAPAQRLEATDFSASRATALSRDLANYRLVHFATHGFFNGEQPELSGLVLSLVDSEGRAQDGFLRLTDIYNLRLPADVVVLSACQSALGKEVRGEGLVGLTRGFMYAGAQRVVATLWQVDDLATAELMRRFYEAMLKERMPPSAALRSAQRALARDPRWRSPFYWSAFQLQGEWR
jgi:CHAT domain-containing protein/Tfp pilus assembly protein PilF